MSDLEFPLKCVVCGKPASCFGRYEDQTGPVEPACDECCGHGCEDGWCVQIDSCSDLIAEFASVRAELDKARADTDWACPCLHTEPCNPQCSCQNAYSSYGCERCCSHGSKEERVAKAKMLASIQDDYAKTVEQLDKARLLVQRLDSENTQYCGKLADCKRELDKAQRERDEALADNLEYQSGFDLRWTADRRAIERWRKANPGKELVSPDQADLCVWLMQQLTLAREELAVEKKAHEASRLRAIVKHIETICEECGHTKTEDGCAFCIKATQSTKEELIKDAADMIDFDQENQCPICHCCGMELSDKGTGHKLSCLAFKILAQRPELDKAIANAATKEAK